MKVRAPDGSLVEAIDLEFEEEATPWTKIKCSDGTVIMIKIEVAEVIRMNFYDQVTGIPLYNVKSTPIFRVTQVPLSIRKIPNEPPKATNDEVQ
jgi:hypothetical protein